MLLLKTDQLSQQLSRWALSPISPWRVAEQKLMAQLTSLSLS